MSKVQVGSLTLPIISGSMMPFLCPGGKVRVECVPANKCHLGDIMVFKEPDRLIAHRVLFCFRLGRRRFFYQKGDSAGTGYWVQGNQMIGVVTHSLDAEGTQRYLRERDGAAARCSIYTHLWRDLVTRARMTVKALAVRTGLRGNHG